jgi:hypothetical protein
MTHGCRALVCNRPADSDLPSKETQQGALICVAHPCYAGADPETLAAKECYVIILPVFIHEIFCCLKYDRLC